VAGCFNLIYGIAAIASAHLFVANAHYVFSPSGTRPDDAARHGSQATPNDRPPDVQGIAPVTDNLRAAFSSDGHPADERRFGVL